MILIRKSNFLKIIILEECLDSVERVVKVDLLLWDSLFKL